MLQVIIVSLELLSIFVVKAGTSAVDKVNNLKFLYPAPQEGNIRDLSETLNLFQSNFSLYYTEKL